MSFGCRSTWVKLSELLLMDLPDRMPAKGAKDNWKTAAGTSTH
jgi:hypothetical protein